MSQVTTARIENSAGKGVDVAGLDKIEDTGKNICTAWVRFDGSTTPPTIKDSFNVDDVVRTDPGNYEINLTVALDNVNYSINGAGNLNAVVHYPFADTVGKFNVATIDENGVAENISAVSIQVFGGKD